MRLKHNEESALTALAWLLVLLLAVIWIVGCDSTARATATVNIVGPSAPVPAPTAAPAVPPPVVIVDVAPPDVTTLIGPPTDTDIPFNEDDATTEQPPACDHPGRGDGNGTPGNGKGQGDERGKACR